MKWITGVALLLILAVQAEAAVFEPKVADICDPAPTATKNGNLQPTLLFGQLLDDPYTGFMPGDVALFTTRADLVHAILAGDSYCAADPSTGADKGAGCPKDATARKNLNTKLAHALDQLTGYLQRHSVPVNPNLGGYQFTFAVTTANVTDLFTNPKTKLAPVCLAGHTPAGSPPPPAASDQSRVPGRLIIRNAVSDLSVAQGSDAFKTLQRASISVTDDVINQSRSYAVQGVVGYGFGQAPVPNWGDAFAEAIPFVSYTRQYVEGANPNKLADIDNIGAGLLGDLLFPALPFQNAFGPTSGMYNDLALTTQVVHSNTSNTDILSGQLTYTPYLNPTVVPGIMVPERVGDFLIMLTPQLLFIYGDVLDSGGNAVLSQTGTFDRIGAHLGLSIKADTGVFSGIGLNATYDAQRSYGTGSIPYIELFTSTLSYTFPQQQYWSLQLSYNDGRNLDTLQKEQVVTLGLGLKY
jgi:hypothetical protein